MEDKGRILAQAERLHVFFRGAGAEPVQTAILQPAETLLDLYGEDIRARAYVTSDALRGEQMLRPDFTVPVVQMHMDSAADPARYTYCGEVFRRQERDPSRPNEYIQVGYELFGGESPAEADAEVFALFSEALSPLDLRAATGDIGLILAAVDGLSASDKRKAALRRHVWRPRRFRALLERFAGRMPLPESRKRLLAEIEAHGVEAVLKAAAPEIGLRSRADVACRLHALVQDAAEPPVSTGETELLEDLLSIRETSVNALAHLRDIAVDLRTIGPAVDRMQARLDALEGQGIDVDLLDFEASYGRTTMEYYDGFVFGFYAEGQPGLPPVATGGRYDALTRILGRGREVPAVGGVVRPELVLSLTEALA
ncbi:ATP phosphoribosyltransferase regulatory subunit [Rhodovulum sulfidophilum]|uniref:Histidine--tRNA ligase n=2 Tax=Rhodovulum sulfidophilum TaxID=35806 RepID=A0A0D6AZT3_RHOSU|nr:ATP phosphoribosyltransferase regulatory subunit [Rhodovulum sulfidophilum]MBK5924693.1 ATP phosphoribosyltransferase regulatory subunit [Rhodovulum sulfidophilum]MBL3551030.1 ATP phosphoribosyltransferase regulatory subunit [Rhodovulum sulfidophilum]MBL3573689.1 ATP phosphoribosyltransferase regulatory subunit [Rhodovulum sulfidophilum]MBL3595723.1 ATP phosphoribosyltransferase regulatory subunit [Rhodovulum sulfidophilum]MBL3608891.1 ATP phosphoribosyltransferase regulatory subunit [Rhodo